MIADLSVYRAMAETALQDCLPKDEGYAHVLVESARYSLLAGGKRLRPCLVLAAADALNVDLEEALPAACAIEMIHTYSLIHDDLPAMDNDTLRRGRPTNHVLYGDAMAILAGDGLLTHAFASLAQNALRYPEHAAAHLRTIQAIADAVGLDGMVAGQALDVYCEKQGTDPKDEKGQLSYIQLKKTAAMIRGALLAGLELGDPTPEMRAAFATYGEKLGIAFQVADDILDETATTEQMGKTVGKDKAEGKLTAVSQYGLEAAQAQVFALTHQAVDAIAPYDAQGFFTRFARELIQRKS